MATTRVVNKPATTKVKPAGGKGIDDVLKEGIEGPLDVPLNAIKELTKGNIGGALATPLTTPIKGIEHGIEAVGELGSPVKAVENAVTAPVKTAENIGSTLSKLTEPSTWIRIGKVIAGAILIGIGLWIFAKAIAPGTTSAVSKAATAPAKAYTQGATRVVRERSRGAGERAGHRAVNTVVKPRTSSGRRKAHIQTLRREGVHPSIVEEVADFEGFK
jgi:hypothetical protein